MNKLLMYLTLLKKEHVCMRVSAAPYLQIAHPAPNPGSQWTIEGEGTDTDIGWTAPIQQSRKFLRLPKGTNTREGTSRIGGFLKLTF